jgi:two-component system response regulator DevR
LPASNRRLKSIEEQVGDTRAAPGGGKAATDVLVVDDDPIVRAWVRTSLDRTEFRPAGDASTIAEALLGAERRRPELFLVDYHLPDGTGVELIRLLRQRQFTAPALVMTAAALRGLNETAREAGAQGTVLKSATPADLVRALQAVIAGKRVFDSRHPRRLASDRPLSPREREIMRLLARGATNRQIAAELGIGLESVKTMVERAYEKLGATRRVDAVAILHKLRVV